MPTHAQNTKIIMGNNVYAAWFVSELPAMEGWCGVCRRRRIIRLKEKGAGRYAGAGLQSHRHKAGRQAVKRLGVQAAGACLGQTESTPKS